MDFKEKVKTAASAMASNMKVSAGGDGAPKVMADGTQARQIIQDWPTVARKAAERCLEKYGTPNEATPVRLIWHNNGPWKRTIVSREEIPHDFPQPHTDVIESTIDYQVPPEKLADLARFDGSVLVDRTRGEVTARCDMEEANILSLNLMHQIVTGACSVEEARRQYGEATSAFMMNRPSPLMEALQFSPRSSGTAYRDESIIGSHMAHQAGEKIKDLSRHH